MLEFVIWRGRGKALPFL